ncbi:putative transcription factor WD40-like family [Helianthus debilis subsp. tardiflorus]
MKICGSRDKTMRVWDCQSGQGLLKLAVKWAACSVKAHAWNVQTSAELSLNGPVGQVYSLVVGNDLLFAGTQEYIGVEV